MENKRSVNRFQVNMPAKIRLEQAGAAEYRDCRINDINFKGLQISLKEKIPLDTSQKMEIILSSDFVLSVEAWVAWHKAMDGRNIYGLYFTRIKDQDRERIYQFIRGGFSEQLAKTWWEEAKPEAGQIDIAKGGEQEMQEANQDTNYEDKRIFARLSVRFPLRFLNISAEKEGLAETVDISAKGIGLTTHEALPVHSSLEMWLALPDKRDPLYTRGEVVWSRQVEGNEYRTGVNLEKADLMGLSRVLRAM